MAKQKKKLEESLEPKKPEAMSKAEIDAELVAVKAREIALEKAAWRGNYVKLTKGDDVKIQDNPDRIEELKNLGWKAE